ncbi:MAG: DUF1592 domain-containing protein, partial [Planctomycetota bacterium]
MTIRPLSNKSRLFALIAISISGSAIARAETQDFAKHIRPFLETHCVRCHGPEKQKSRIRLDRLTAYESRNGALWTKVHEVLVQGEMPPEDETQPSASDRERVASWIAAQQRVSRSGKVRRLNRRELSAALQDLTGLNVDYASMLPADGKVDGFDTGAAGLQDAADSVVRIMTITRRAVEAIRFMEPAGLELTGNLSHEKHPKREIDQWRKEHGYRVKLKGSDLKTKGVLLSPAWLGSRDRSSVEVPAPEGSVKGVAKLTLVLSAHKGMKGLPTPHLGLDVPGQDHAHIDITGTFEKPQTLTFYVQLDELPPDRKKIVRVSFRSLVELPYQVKGFPNDTRTKPGKEVPPGTTIYKPLYDRKKIRNPLEHPVPYILLQGMTFEPNHVAAWPPESWGSKLGVIDDSVESAEKLLSLWMERAWRRPVERPEVDSFLGLYRKLRTQGMTFDNALRGSFQSVLMSGPFRYHASVSDKDSVVAQHAIASRLSFMLLGEPPDATLRQLAKKDKLRDPKILDGQVDRLLADSRSDSFFRPFVTQWLEIGQPITIAMRSIKNQDFRFGRHLRESMRAETVAYVRQLFLDNRPTRELVRSDWAMSNDILAHFYGHQPLEGSELRRVRLKKNDPRGGGILGHGGIQSMLTWMGENWVIYRGAWTMRHILDDPPPPPPLEVPELVPSEGKNRGKTFRELLKRHQEDPKCSVCHAKMDPIGFAFQNFDLSGRWRDVEYERYVRNELDGKVEWYGKGKTRPIDTEGRLPRGETFDTYSQFLNLISKHYVRDLTRGVLKKLVLYGTGRKPEIDDLSEIESILNAEA